MKIPTISFLIVLPLLGFTQVDKLDESTNSGDSQVVLPTAMQITQLKSAYGNDALFEISNQFKMCKNQDGLLQMEILINGNNVFIGESAGDETILFDWPEGRKNTFIGTNSGALNHSGYSNTFIGASSGEENHIGHSNTFVGERSGGENDDGVNNTFLGAKAGLSNEGGNNNTFLGFNAGVYLSNSTDNTFVGAYAGQGRIGNQNVLIGRGAGSFINSGTGSGNIMIGYEAGSGKEVSNKLFIDNSPSLFPLIYGDFETDEIAIHGNLGVRTKHPDSELHLLHGTTHGGGTTGLRLENAGSNDNWWNFYTVNMTGNLALFSKAGNGTSVGYFDDVSGVYTSTSDRRVKKNIQSLDDVLEKVIKLNAKAYHFKVQSDQDEKSIGLIAQDVLDLFPELVSYDEETDRYSLDYGTFSIVAIKAIQEQQKIIEELLQNQTKILKMLHDKPTYKIKDSE